MDDKNPFNYYHRVRKHQSQLKEARVQIEIERATTGLSESENLDNLPAKPCAKCLEQKRQLRNARAKLQQRKNALAKREAAVLAQAQSIRRLQILLQKKIEANEKESDTTTTTTQSDESSPSLIATSVPSNASGEQVPRNQVDEMVGREEERQIQEMDGTTQQQQFDAGNKVKQTKTHSTANMFHQYQQQQCDDGDSVNQSETKSDHGGRDCNGDKGKSFIVKKTKKTVPRRNNKVPATIVEEEDHGGDSPTQESNGVLNIGKARRLHQAEMDQLRPQSIGGAAGGPGQKPSLGSENSARKALGTPHQVGNNRQTTWISSFDASMKFCEISLTHLT